MGKRVQQTPPTTAHFVDPFHDAQALTPITGDERTILRTYAEFLTDGPCGHKSHELLHTTYTARGKFME